MKWGLRNDLAGYTSEICADSHAFDGAWRWSVVVTRTVGSVVWTSYRLPTRDIRRHEWTYNSLTRKLSSPAPAVASVGPSPASSRSRAVTSPSVPVPKDR